MRCFISFDGKLVALPDNSTEIYALRAWREEKCKDNPDVLVQVDKDEMKGDVFEQCNNWECKV